MSIRCLNIYNDLETYEEKFRANFDEYFTVDESIFLIFLNQKLNQIFAIFLLQVMKMN